MSGTSDARALGQAGEAWVGKTVQFAVDNVMRVGKVVDFSVTGDAPRLGVTVLRGDMRWSLHVEDIEDAGT